MTKKPIAREKYGTNPEIKKAAARKQCSIMESVDETINHCYTAHKNIFIFKVPKDLQQLII